MKGNTGDRTMHTVKINMTLTLLILARILEKKKKKNKYIKKFQLFVTFFNLGGFLHVDTYLIRTTVDFNCIMKM